MICPLCKKGNHGACRGGTWCDCQHRGQPKPKPASSSSSDNGGGNIISNTIDAVIDLLT